MFFHVFSIWRNKFVMKYCVLIFRIIEVLLISYLFLDIWSKDSVRETFCFQINALPVDAKLEKEEKDVFKCYSISHDEVDRLLSHQFHEFGFMGWARIDRGVNVGYGKHGYISQGNVWRNARNGSDDFNEIAMYVDREKCLLYFCRRLIYGR